MYLVVMRIDGVTKVAVGDTVDEATTHAVEQYNIYINTYYSQQNRSLRLTARDYQHLTELGLLSDDGEFPIAIYLDIFGINAKDRSAYEINSFGEL